MNTSTPNATPIALKEQPITVDVLAEKYLKAGETSAHDLYQRVAKALASAEAPECTTPPPR